MLTLPQMTMFLLRFGCCRRGRGHSSPSISIAAARPLIGGSGW